MIDSILVKDYDFPMLVSVIIPTCDRFGLLCEAVASVRAQHFDDLEIIIVDDGSSDETEEFFGRRQDVRYLRIEHSGRPGLVRNRGAEIAKGRYLAFLDSDDLWLPGKLHRQLPLMEEHVLVHTLERWERDGKVVSQKHRKHKRSGDVFSDALNKCMIGPSSVMMERELFCSLGGFDESIEIAEDYELWLRVTACRQIGYIDEPLVLKRAGHDDQLSMRYGQIEIFHINALRSLLDRGWFSEHAGPEHEQAARQRLSEKCLIYARGAEKRGRTEEAREFRELSEAQLHSLS